MAHRILIQAPLSARFFFGLRKPVAPPRIAWTVRLVYLDGSFNFESSWGFLRGFGFVGLFAVAGLARSGT